MQHSTVPPSSGLALNRRSLFAGGGDLRHRLAEVLLALAGVGLGTVLALVITAETVSSLTAPGGLLIGAGRLTASIGA